MNQDKETELAQFSLFMQLNDSGSDLMADLDEIKRLVQTVNMMKHGTEN